LPIFFMLIFLSLGYNKKAALRNLILATRLSIGVNTGKRQSRISLSIRGFPSPPYDGFGFIDLDN